MKKRAAAIHAAPAGLAIFLARENRARNDTRLFAIFWVVFLAVDAALGDAGAALELRVV